MTNAERGPTTKKIHINLGPSLQGNVEVLCRKIWSRRAFDFVAILVFLHEKYVWDILGVGRFFDKNLVAALNGWSQTIVCARKEAMI